MSYLVLARKYRPQTFEEVVEQDHVTRTLANAISSGRVAHAILFSGPRGTGKTTIARILAKAMNCREGPRPVPCNACQSCREITAGSAADVFEIDGASNNSVDQVRELRDNVKFMPAHSLYKIYIIDEVHMLSTAAFNALLKTLEEPPAHVMFFFATTEPHKIPITILSRCQRYDLRRIDLKAVVTHLAGLCRAESVEFPEESLWLIARQAGGSMRDALSLLDQMISSAGGPIHHEQVLDLLGAVDSRTLFRISGAVLERDMAQLLEILDDAYARGRDLKRLYADLIGHFRDLLVIKVTKTPAQLVNLSEPEIRSAQEQIQSISTSELTQWLDQLMKEEPGIRFSAQPRLALEMAFIRLGLLRPALPIETLIGGLDALRKDLFRNPGGAVSGTEPDRCEGLPASGEGRSVSGPSMVEPVQGDAPGRAKAPDNDRQGAEAPLSLDSAWQAILNRISREFPFLSPNLAESVAVGLSGDVLQVEISGTQFQLSQVQREKNREILTRVCSAQFGRPLKVQVRAGIAAVSENPDTGDENKKRRTEALAHPLVSEAVEIFEGKVIDVKLL
jgi:DNA polymerase-3 subunit gamma/tau